jgi:hypothetical protein
VAFFFLKNVLAIFPGLVTILIVIIFLSVYLRPFFLALLRISLLVT